MDTEERAFSAEGAASKECPVSSLGKQSLYSRPLVWGFLDSGTWFLRMWSELSASESPGLLVKIQIPSVNEMV